MIYTFESHPLDYCSSSIASLSSMASGSAGITIALGKVLRPRHAHTEVDDRWRDLVLQRSGQSPLAVVMHRQNARPGEHLMEYFVKLLNDHWTRIGKVDLTLWYNDKRMWETFARPSASLMYFSVTKFTPPYDLIFPKTVNYSPSMHHVSSGFLFHHSSSSPNQVSVPIKSAAISDVEQRTPHANVQRSGAEWHRSTRRFARNASP